MAETVATDVTVLSDAKLAAQVLSSISTLPDDVCHYLAHLGFLPGTLVEILRSAPAGDPVCTALTVWKWACAARPRSTSS